MHVDYVIVGAGTAGCVLADRLSERGARVLVLEAGGSDRHMHVQIPAAFAKLFKSKRDWAFHTTPQTRLNGRRVFWPRGKMLGGSSAMNAQIHQWCSPSDFDAWGDGWRYSEMEAHLKSVDAALNGGRLREPSALSHAFLQAAAAEGLPSGGSYNGGALSQSAWISETAHRDGARWSCADAFLRPAIARGAHVIKSALVHRVIFDGKRATGVAFKRGHQVEIAHADRGVILAAGAVNSPRLLLLSGVGPADHLRAHGVQMVADAPNVGRNLQDHLMVVTHHAAKRPITLKSAESPGNLLQYLLRRRGMLASNVAEAIAFTSSAPGGPIDLELVFAPVLFENEGLSPPSAHGYSVAVVLLSPKARGQITLANASPESPPLIDPAYLDDDNDLERMVEGMQLAQRIVAQAPLAAETASTLLPKSWDKDQIVTAIRATAHTIYHPVGTCRMGTDADSVTDANLRVRGVEALWVADASVIPNAPTGHPNAVVAALADRAAKLIGG